MPIKRQNELEQNAATIGGNTLPDEKTLDDKFPNKATVDGVYANHTALLASLMSGLAYAVAQIDPKHCSDKAKKVISDLFATTTSKVTFSWARRALIEAGYIKENEKIAEMEFVVNGDKLTLYWR